MDKVSKLLFNRDDILTNVLSDCICTVSPNICGPSLWDSLRVTLLKPNILTWLFRGFFQIMHPYFKHNFPYFFYPVILFKIGFGGLRVACWPLVPKFAGSNPAEAVGFLGRKYPQHAFLRRGSTAVGPMS